MIAYVKNYVDFSTRDILEFEEYSFVFDIEYAEKSSISVIQKPNIENDDYVICMDEGKQIFFGICEDISSSNDSGYTITLKQIECLFDRKIIVGTESVIQSTGIEDFIRNEIRANWTNSGDTLLDKDYITVSASTHTQIQATVNTENGLYNLSTFLGNAKEYYGIFLDFTYTDSALNIAIRKDSASALPIDVTISDVCEYEETYAVDVLAKLNVKWKVPDSEDEIGPTTYRTYYLKADRTLTTSSTDPNRAMGVISSLYVETETEAEMYQSVLNEFASNTYEHKITFQLASDSVVYPASSYYVGRKAQIKTKSGIQTSIITAMSHSSNSSFIGFVFGKLRITLIDKLREYAKR